MESLRHYDYCIGIVREVRVHPANRKRLRERNYENGCIVCQQPEPWRQAFSDLPYNRRMDYSPFTGHDVMA
jgi:hypothetical protein